MDDIIDVGDTIRLNDGTTAIINGLNRQRGIYWADGKTLYRHEFQPLKWEGDTLGNTGIGVCAKNGSEQH